MNYAILQNNICENVIECLEKDVEDLSKAIGKDIVLIPNEFTIGDTYIGGIWSKKKSQPAEMEILNAKLEATQAVVDEIIFGGAL